jgi:hypothetical protein
MINTKLKKADLINHIVTHPKFNSHIKKVFEKQL